jgi:hypothetical protein
VNRRGTMNKLKMLVLTVMTAATVGTGALAAAPSASAAPLACTKLRQQAVIYRNVWELLKATGYGGTRVAAGYELLADGLEDAYRSRCLA